MQTQVQWTTDELTPYSSVSLWMTEWLSEIFSGTKHRTVSSATAELLYTCIRFIVLGTNFGMLTPKLSDSSKDSYGTGKHCGLCVLFSRPTQPFILTGSINRVPTCPIGVKVTSVGWQITLCDPIDKWRPVVLRWISRRTIRSFTFYLFILISQIV